MLQAIQAFLRPFADHYTRVKVLANNNNNNDDDDDNYENDKDKYIENANVECQWMCMGYAMTGDTHEYSNIMCFNCTIPASSGLFGWYSSIYGNDNGKSLDESAAFYSTPVAAKVTEHRDAPPPPLEKRRNMLIESIVKDPLFGERVESAYRAIGTYPVGIGKGEIENMDWGLVVAFIAGNIQKIK